jgi:biopolymer transport protein ExbD
MNDPDLSVVVRGDGSTKYRKIVRVMDLLQKANIVKVELATDAEVSEQK